MNENALIMILGSLEDMSPCILIVDIGSRIKWVHGHGHNNYEESLSFH